MNYSTHYPWKVSALLLQLTALSCFSAYISVCVITTPFCSFITTPFCSFELFPAHKYPIVSTQIELDFQNEACPQASAQLVNTVSTALSH